MVAITVILAAVIGTFVLGLGGNVSSAPQAQISFDYNQDASSVDLVHDGGDQLQESELSVTSTGGGGVAVVSGGGTFIAGDVVASGNYDPGETIRLIWEDPQSDSTNTIARSEAPS
jgi:FlaG/FlaF family flagellin (archaellin)